MLGYFQTSTFLNAEIPERFKVWSLGLQVLNKASSRLPVPETSHLGPKP